MQVTKVNVVETPKFKPRAFTITIESEEEARAMHAIFDYSPNADLIGESLAGTIRKQIDLGCGARSVNGVIAKGITQAKFFADKKDVTKTKPQAMNAWDTLTHDMIRNIGLPPMGNYGFGIRPIY
jgi:hypothetical protein